MDPNQGNPYMQGANPFMQDKPGSPQADAPGAPMAPQDVMGGMPYGDGGGSSETTKPRQMPGGPDPMGAGMPDPMGGGMAADSNTPQQPPAGTSAQASLRDIRVDIASSNPDLPYVHVHAIALRVHALISEGASPMGPVTPIKPGDGYRPTERNQQQPAGRRRRLPVGDSGNPGDRNSVTHPNHPQHAQYGNQVVLQPNVRAGNDDDDSEDGWRSQYGGRDPLEDRAYGRGYQGNNPHLFGLGDAVVQHVIDKRRQKGKAPLVEFGDKKAPIGAPVQRVKT